MSEAEARLHALLLIERLTAVAQDEEDEAEVGERPVRTPVAALAALAERSPRYLSRG